MGGSRGKDRHPACIPFHNASAGQQATALFIDVPEVRDAIKRIMEGGEAAFNLRKEKYGF